MMLEFCLVGGVLLWRCCEERVRLCRCGEENDANQSTHEDFCMENIHLAKFDIERAISNTSNHGKPRLTEYPHTRNPCHATKTAPPILFLTSITTHSDGRSTTVAPCKRYHNVRQEIPPQMKPQKTTLCLLT